MGGFVFIILGGVLIARERARSMRQNTATKMEVLQVVSRINIRLYERAIVIKEVDPAYHFPQALGLGFGHRQALNQLRAQAMLYQMMPSLVFDIYPQGAAPLNPYYNQLPANYIPPGLQYSQPVIQPGYAAVEVVNIPTAPVIGDIVHQKHTLSLHPPTYGKDLAL
jgi:hypothetical protein